MLIQECVVVRGSAIGAPRHLALPAAPNWLRRVSTFASVVATIFSAAAPANAQCGVESCLQAHPSAGCDQASCCEVICSFNPICCLEEWDSECVTLAHAMCEICGASGTGSCFIPHGTASCADPTCCAQVCAVDPFCCDESWDIVCAGIAANACEVSGGTCGDAAAGDCHAPHGSAACSDLECCTAVCAVAPECCQNSWDFICVAIADSVCASGTCEVVCAPQSAVHPEDCATVVSLCSQTATTLTPGDSVCGDLPVAAASVDRDLFVIQVPDPDGDGIARVTLTLEASSETFAALVRLPCDSIAQAPLHAQTELCGEYLAQACVAAGTWHVIVVPGAFPSAAVGDRPCGESQYELGVTVDQVCGDVCGSGGSCTSPHAEPGCADAACCALVCASDPLCCTLEWDAVCAKAATASCGGEVPANDDCLNALVIGSGIHTVDLGLATLDGPDLPSACTASAAKNVYKDVWFRIEGVRGTVTASTCGSAVHPALMRYSGDCAALVIEDCAYESLIGCGTTPGTTLTWEASCDSSYLLRVGVLPGVVGDAQIVVTAVGCAACLGDLDNSGAVSGGDLAVLLGAWNTADPVADLDGNGAVSGSDLAIMLGAWGPCP